ncbi:hypothetical protein GGH92_007631, partial [Coemansia sp. RSA 2673]
TLTHAHQASSSKPFSDGNERRSCIEDYLDSRNPTRKPPRPAFFAARLPKQDILREPNVSFRAAALHMQQLPPARPADIA